MRIDENPQHAAAPFPRKLNIDQLKSKRLDRRLQQAHQGVAHFYKVRSLKAKRGPSAPFHSLKKKPLEGAQPKKSRAVSKGLGETQSQIASTSPAEGRDYRQCEFRRKP